jgi:aspartate/methionine/tyrosine aminotransferase
MARYTLETGTHFTENVDEPVLVVQAHQDAIRTTRTLTLKYQPEEGLPRTRRVIIRAVTRLRRLITELHPLKTVYLLNGVRHQ